MIVPESPSTSTRKKTAAARKPAAVFSLWCPMGSERQTLKDADRSETAKQLPGSGRSLLAQLVPVPVLPVLVLVLPLLAWRRRLAFSVLLFSVPVLPLLAWRRRLAFSVPLFSVPLCLVLPSSAPLFSALASWRQPS
jgi:hypothetical protein